LTFIVSRDGAHRTACTKDASPRSSTPQIADLELIHTADNLKGTQIRPQSLHPALNPYARSVENCTGIPNEWLGIVVVLVDLIGKPAKATDILKVKRARKALDIG
jgi:hypothetical protein